MTGNDVIMTSLPKTMEKIRTSAKLKILYIYHLKGIDESYPKMYCLLNLSHYVKSYGHLCQILASFMMPAPQIWPCHVTQEANLKKKLFFPNSAFNIRKSYKISSRKALYFSQEPHGRGGGVENTLLLGLNQDN